MIFSDIIKLSHKLETERLDRGLSEIMEEEYQLDEEMKQKVRSGEFSFPDVLCIRTDKKSLVRVQGWFSAKVHIKRTPLYFHQHEYIEMLYMYKGSCRQYIESLKESIILEEGDFFLLNQNVTHALWQEDSDAVLIKIIVPLSCIAFEFLKRMNHESELFHFFVNAKSDKNEYYHYIHFHKIGEEEKLFIEKMMEEFYCGGSYSEEAIRNYLQLLMIHIERGGAQYNSCRHLLSHSSVRKGNIIQYIYEHSDSVTLEELSGKFLYNQSYLSRIIKQNCNMSFRDLLREIRIEKAMLLLAGSDYPVEKIALMVGYKNAIPVYREIKNRYGMSPTEYREAYSKNKIDIITNE